MKRAFLSLIVIAAGLSRASADTITNLIYRVPLDESSGIFANERVSGYNGTLFNFTISFGNTPWLNPGLQFAGAQSVFSLPPAGDGVTNQLTLSAWVRQSSTGSGSTKGIIGKGRFGGTEQQAYMMGTYLGRPFFKANWNNTGGNPASVVQIAPGSITMNEWTHVAVTSNNARVIIYVNGVSALNVDQAVTIGSSSAGVWVGYDLHNFIGDIRDARIYNRALSAADVAQLIQERAVFSAAYAGLWSGAVTLNEVKEPAAGTWTAAPAFTERVLMHVDADGVGRLLPEATVMQTRTASQQQVVVSMPSLLPNFDGITSRGGKMIGQRFSTASFPLPAGSQLLADGGGGRLTSSWTMDAVDPANPFRHKYHPDLGNGRNLARTIWFHSAPGDTPSDHTFSSMFYEEMAGLHKTTLEARGPVTFTRVSTSGKLNQP